MASSPQNVVSLGRPGWSRARLAGLAPDENGAIALALAPAVSRGAALVDVPGPYEPALVGLAVGACGEIVDARPAERRIIASDPRCDACLGQAPLDGVSGLAASPCGIVAADPTAGGVHVLTLPELELAATWTGATAAPRRVSVDGAGRIYVLDTTAPRVTRLRADGRPDTQYAASTAAALMHARDLCVALDGRAFVSVRGRPDLLCFDPSGATLPGLAAPPDAPALRPGALASDGHRLYIADGAAGGLWTYDLDDARWLGALHGFRAPVTGLAVDREGHLYVRTGARAQIVRLEASGAYAPHGELEAGPFDAGRGVAWMRAHVVADEPAGTRVILETALADAPGAPPPFRRHPAADVLVHAPEPAGLPIDPAARFLWMRVRLETDNPAVSPRLRAIVAETPGENYLERLPAIYTRADAEVDGFLRASLETMRAELGDQEAEIAALATRLDPAVAPPDHLPWLASWLAAELPPRASVADARALLIDAHRLYPQRGTLAGLREMVRLYTGVTCDITESFRARRLWALDGPACLGFDTGLLPALPDGMVVPGPSVIEPALQGLRASYYLDDHFGASADAPGQPPVIDRDGRFPRFAPPTTTAGNPAAFSVLWTGQVFARFADVYTFHFKCNGGARVFVDGAPIIDSWIAPWQHEPRGSVPLQAERWVPLRIEHWSTSFNSGPPALSWSSRNQTKEPVPQECLYAIDDDNVAPDLGQAPALIVGDAIVGAHGPLAAEDFGAPLFADTAHHFTVRVPARDARRPGVLEAVRAVLDAEKPAHTDYHLCVVEPTFVVGRQARVGVDAVVPHPLAGGRYDEAALGRDARLGAAPAHADTLRVEENLWIGATTILR